CFFCFTVVFCASGMATYWTVTNSIVVSEQTEKFLCCGKKSAFGERNSIEDEMCTSEILEIEEEIYGMVLTSFLWYSIHCKNNLDRKGKYVLAKLSETGF
ncbi:hypothetical protein E2320_020811, partial [Naja naja]